MALEVDEKSEEVKAKDSLAAVCEESCTAVQIAVRDKSISAAQLQRISVFFGVDKEQLCLSEEKGLSEVVAAEGLQEVEEEEVGSVLDDDDCDSPEHIVADSDEECSEEDEQSMEDDEEEDDLPARRSTPSGRKTSS